MSALCYYYGHCYADGAIVLLPSGSIDMYGSTCSNNTCQGNGACAYVTGYMALYNNSIISGNRATLNGAGIYTDFGATVMLTDSVITGNTAQQSGGAFFGFTSQSLLQENTTTITNNSAGCCYASGYGSKLKKQQHIKQHDMC
jgi:Periplasmic copper-binding protein (NosD)